MRTCVIDLPGLCGRLLDRLEPGSTASWFAALIGKGRRVIRPVLPAVTMTAQATYTTGVAPGRHGIVANGLAAFRDAAIRDHLDLDSYPEYRRNVSFWEQSNELLTAPRVWSGTARRVAMLFLQSSIGACDVVVTPKPRHEPDGRTIFDCWTNPPALNQRLKDQLGDFPLHHYWGPMAGMKSSEWIAAAARLVWEWEPCDLQWVYVPQLDYDLQRLGPDDPAIVRQLTDVLALLTPLVERVGQDGGRVAVVSDYGITPVSRSCPLNVHLRKAKLLTVDGAGEMDYERSDAFALADHQVAHVYCRDREACREAESVLWSLPEVRQVYRGGARAEVGLDHPRSGDLVVFSHSDAWFEYRWWEDWSKAPSFAWTVDIHRKPGYDPTELFFNPSARRIRADEPGLVKGSHGSLPPNQSDWPVLIGAGGREGDGPLEATAVAGLL